MSCRGCDFLSRQQRSSTTFQLILLYNRRAAEDILRRISSRGCVILMRNQLKIIINLQYPSINSCRGCHMLSLQQRSYTGIKLKFLIQKSCGGYPPEDELQRMFNEYRSSTVYLLILLRISELHRMSCRGCLLNKILYNSLLILLKINELRRMSCGGCI